MCTKLKYKRIIIVAGYLLFCLFVLWAPVSGADSLDIRDAYTVRRWGVEEGLPEGVVTAVNIFDDGFLWLTTPRHVVRFDGAEFISIPREAYPENRPRRFNCIISDQEGSRWVSGEDGVMRNAGNGWELVPLRGNIDYSGVDLWQVETPDGRLDQEPHLELFWIKEVSDGTIWAASNAGMYKFDGEAFCRVSPEGDTAPAFFTSACIDEMAQIWLVGAGGLFRFDGKRYQPVEFPCGEGREALFQVFTGNGGALWGKRVDGKLFRSNGEEWSESAPPGLRHMTLNEQADGYVWYGAVEGIYRSNIKNPRLLVRAGIDKAHDVRALKMSADGSLWAGSGNGLFQLKSRKVRMFAVDQSESDQSVTALLPDKRGGFWVGVEGHGIMMGSAGEFSLFRTIPPVLNSATVSAMCLKRDNSFWVGTRDDHLWQVMPDGEVNQSRSMEGYASRGITALAESTDGYLWVGTREGLLKRDDKNRLNSVDGPDDTILALYADSANGVWAATQSSGLWHIDAHGRRRIITQSDGLPSDTIRALHCDPDGRMWMATAGGVVLLLSLGSDLRPCAFTRDQGLPFDDIWQMLDDGKGNLWLGTRQRIMRVSKDDMSAVADGEKKVLTVRTFGRDDGLDHGLVGGDHSGPLAMRTQDGLLWFATHSGLAMINPVELKEKSADLNIYIEELSARLRDETDYHRDLNAHKISSYRAPEEMDDEIEIPAGCRNISFRYTAPVFVNPEQILFRTRLDGYEHEWSAPSTARRREYSRLPPGEYCFRVMVSRPTGGWLESESGVEFSVNPFFWQRTWFRILSGLLLLVAVGATVGLLVRRRETLKLEKERREAREREREMERKRAVERERIRIARDIHDDLGAGLTQMALQSELAQSEHGNPVQLKQRLDQIFKAASSLAQSLNEIVWAVNPKNDTLEGMLSYLENYADEYLRASGLRFRPELPMDYPDMQVSSMLRHHIFCAIREALHNTVKYAGPCEVQLKAEIAASTLRIELRDNGCGFDPESIPSRTGRHNGIVNMRNRMKEIGGSFELDAKQGQGTRLSFEVNLIIDN